MLALLLPLLAGSSPAAATPEQYDAERRAAQSLYEQGRFQDALARAEAARALAEQNHGAEHERVADAYNLLGLINGRLGKLAEAEASYRRVFDIRTNLFGADDPRSVLVLNNLGEVHRAAGDLGSAEAVHRRSLAARERIFGPETERVAVSLNNLALVVAAEGRLGEAEALLRRALAIRERVLGPEHDLVAQTLNNLAELLRQAGRYAEATELLLHALAIRQKSLGPDHPDVALVLNNLGILYGYQGLFAEAEPLHRRALAIRERALGPNHPRVAQSLGNVAFVARKLGRLDEAESLHRRGLAVREHALGPDHPEVAFDLNNLAEVLREEGKMQEAEALYRRALAIREAALGAGHALVGETMQDLATLMREEARAPEAMALQRRAVEIRKASLGPSHPEVAVSLGQLARIHRQRGEMQAALDLSREATRIYRARIGGADNRRAAGSTREQAFRREIYLGHLAALSALAASEAAPERRQPLLAEAIEVAQLSAATGTGQALTRMAARFAAGNDALASLVRERQDAVDATDLLETRLVEALSMAPAQRRPDAEARLRAEHGAAVEKLARLDDDLRTRFPDYAALANPQPLTGADFDRLLHADEAAIAFLAGEEETVVLALRRGSVRLVTAKIGRRDLDREVSFLRAGLYAEGVAAPDDLPPFDAESAHALYARLLGPLEDFLAGARHLIVVPDGGLQSLPFAVLVTAPPPELGDWADYAKVAWLGRKVALSTLPSLSALAALRATARPSAAPLPFAGFGDPDLDGPPAQGKPVMLASLMRGGTADVQAVRQLAPLPESAAELTQLARARGAGGDALFLRGRATESVLRMTDLSQYKVLAFATHALVAGEISGLSEPALVLTPPSRPSIGDDGLLTAGEIARLRLDAEWVILSACNTAASDGSPAGEGLSGLARAFFYAGTRALLVSHWPVVSQAAVRLTTDAFAALEQEPGIGRAEALRRAMNAMLDAPEQPAFRHPMFWAPFVIAGEGGAGR